MITEESIDICRSFFSLLLWNLAGPSPLDGVYSNVQLCRLGDRFALSWGRKSRCPGRYERDRGHDSGSLQFLCETVLFWAENLSVKWNVEEQGEQRDKGEKRARDSHASTYLLDIKEDNISSASFYNSSTPRACFDGVQLNHPLSKYFSLAPLPSPLVYATGYAFFIRINDRNEFQRRSPVSTSAN